MKYFLIKILGVFLVSGLVFACVKKSKYPTVPEIEYKDFVLIDSKSAYLQLKFSDGDGNVTLNENDTTKNFFYTYYYYDTIIKKFTALYSPDLNDTFRFAYSVRTPLEAPSFKGKQISGEISVKLQEYRHSKYVKRVKYVMYLLDQDGNKSNVVTSPEINVP